LTSNREAIADEQFGEAGGIARVGEVARGRRNRLLQHRPRIIASGTTLQDAAANTFKRAEAISAQIKGRGRLNA
jgi:hypothetical protein